jgi:uncharacterized iron-regulated protein
MNPLKPKRALRNPATWVAALSFMIAPVAMARPAVAPIPAAEASVSSAAIAQTTVIALDAQPTLAELVPTLANKRAIFVGEQHDRYDHSLIQLEFIRRLHAINPRIAIGMEAFQQPFQAVLDDYVAGRISEEQLLRQTEYYQRWGVDYRLVDPILRFAREHQLPVIALNVRRELTRRVASTGMANLPTDMKNELPAEMQPPSPEYRRRLEAVFALHEGSDDGNFDHFVDAQLLWDEGMAERAARFLAENPEYQMVILAGNQHIAWDDTIPGRLKRRLPIDTATILNSWSGHVDAGLADYLLIPEPQSLAPSGRIGIAIEEGTEGVSITACDEGTDCSEDSIMPGDRIVRVDDAAVSSIADLRLSLRSKLPGDTVEVQIIRPLDSGLAALTHVVTLR